MAVFAVLMGSLFTAPSLQPLPLVVAQPGLFKFIKCCRKFIYNFPKDLQVWLVEAWGLFVGFLCMW